MPILEFGKNLFNAQGFIPHGHCYLWKQDLVWLHIISDAAIALAYFSIPMTLIYFISRRRDVPFNWVFLMFGCFIIACGTGHLMEIWTLWHPTYWLSGLLKFLTALISVITAVGLIPLIPKALALPSPAQLEAANQELEATLSKLQELQFQFIQTEKMFCLGQLVSGVAYEINNPVNFIHGNLIHTHQYTQELLNLLTLYQRSYPQPMPEIQAALKNSDLDFIRNDLPKILSSMKIGADRILRIVLSLRNFVRLDEAEIKLANIHEGIDSTLVLLQNQLKPKAGHPGITVVKEYGELPMVECYAGQLNQVFMSLIGNAIDVLGNSKGVDFQSPNSAEPCPTIRIRTKVLNDADVQILISDNGQGMSEQVRQRVFQPFFTTKSAGKGTGLGLSISYQIIVETHGGQMECISAPGQGTTFQLVIPIRQSQKGVLPAEQLSDSLTRS